MGYFFSADITRYDASRQQYERGAWLIHDPRTGLWSYDRSQMRGGNENEKSVGLAFDAATLAAYKAGNLIDVHIHPLIDESSPHEVDPRQSNIDNRTFSQPSPDGPGDAGVFAGFSKANGAPLHAAVIGSDGSISYADGGGEPKDYRGENVVRVAPPGTIPMLQPGE